jgi:hypothetical protein
MSRRECRAPARNASASPAKPIGQNSIGVHFRDRPQSQTVTCCVSLADFGGLPRPSSDQPASRGAQTLGFLSSIRLGFGVAIYCLVQPPEDRASDRRIRPRPIAEHFPQLNARQVNVRASRQMRTDCCPSERYCSANRAVSRRTPARREVCNVKKTRTGGRGHNHGMSDIDVAWRFLRDDGRGRTVGPEIGEKIDPIDAMGDRPIVGIGLSVLRV